MTNKAKPRPKPLNEGYKPVQKGWASKVQGGFKPSGNVAANPPKGGSGVKPPPANSKK
jgi:hypothetical protein